MDGCEYFKIILSGVRVSKQKLHWTNLKRKKDFIQDCQNREEKSERGLSSTPQQQKAVSFFKR